MLIPSARTGIRTQRNVTKLSDARTSTRTAVRRGFAPKTSRRVRPTRVSGQALNAGARFPQYGLEHPLVIRAGGLQITRSARVRDEVAAGTAFPRTTSPSRRGPQR